MNASVSAKVLQLDDYRRPLMSASDAPDLEGGPEYSEKLFVQVVLSDTRPELVGRTWSCRTVRVSAAYVEFVCDQAIPVGALVDLWVDLAAARASSSSPGACWNRPSDGNRALIGIEPEEGAATDFAAWVELHG